MLLQRSGLLVLAVVTALGAGACDRDRSTMWRAASKRVADPRAYAAQQEKARAAPAAAKVAAASKERAGEKERAQVLASLKAITEARSAFDKARIAQEVGTLRALPNEILLRPLHDLLLTNADGMGPAAALVLGELGDPSYIKPLLGALRSSDVLVAEAAAEALGGFKSPAVSSGLIDFTEGDKPSTVRVAAIGGLARLGNQGVVPSLLKTLRDEDESVRRAGAVALGKLGDERALEPLGELLRGTHDDETRLLAAAGLLSLGSGKQSLPVLADLLAEGSTSMKTQAFEALSKHGNREAVLVAVLDKCGAAPYRVPDLLERIKALCDASCRRMVKVRRKAAKSAPAQNAFETILKELPSGP